MKTLLSGVILSVLLIATSAQGSDWNILRKTILGTASYDRDSIKQYRGDLITVSVKYAYSPEGISEFKEAFPEVNEPQHISYTIYVYELHCLGEAFRLIRATTYNTDEIVVKGTDLSLLLPNSSPSEHITPGSIMEQLHDASCAWLRYNPAPGANPG